MANRDMSNRLELRNLFEEISACSNIDSRFSRFFENATECARAYLLAMERQKGCDGMGMMTTMKEEFKCALEALLQHCCAKGIFITGRHLKLTSKLILIGSKRTGKDGKTMKRSFGIVPLASAFFVFTLAFSSCAASNDINSVNAINSVLDEAKQEGKAVMLELGSVGCIPCEQMKPVMQRLSAEYGKKLVVHFVDVRVDAKTARRFGVHAIPTRVFLDKNGREFHRHVGYYSFEEIQAVLKRAGF